MRRSVLALSLVLPLALAVPAGSGALAETDPLGAAETVTEADRLSAETALVEWGYDPGRPDGIWRRESVAALRAFQADWGLPVTGELDKDLIARLTRLHPATRSQWFTTEEGCEVWNPYPQAQETVTWSGPCEGGKAEGEGTLVWSYTVQGVREHARYDGEYHEGEPHGMGSYVTNDGNRYTGGWRKGVHHGEGVYEWVGGARYEGNWLHGRPDGEGTLTMGYGSEYSGTWTQGCLRHEDEWIALFTQQEECGAFY